MNNNGPFRPYLAVMKPKIIFPNALPTHKSATIHEASVVSMGPLGSGVSSEYNFKRFGLVHPEVNPYAITIKFTINNNLSKKLKLIDDF